jgi:rod shape-determining protein MreC
MKRKQQMEIPPKVILLILSFICIVLLVITNIFSATVPFLNDISGSIFVPMEKGVNAIGTFIEERKENIRNAKQLREENEKLQEKVDEYRAQIQSLESDQSELDNLRALYELDRKYESYPKVGARIIASDDSNWYSNFTIDKGSDDGISVDMNVIAGDGLVGIVYSVGKNYSKVRSIIDDTSYVSAMFTTTADNCLVNGDLKSIEDNYITVDHINKDAKINEGDELITSNVSSKFLPGITIGYVSDIEVDSNSLTKSGKVTPVVDFKHLEEVLVITQLKETGEDE